MSKLVCTQCGFVGKPKRAIKGNSAIEIILWLFFIVPGLIYSIWRSNSRHKICPDCKSIALIPIDSPRAKKIMLENGISEQEIISMKEEEANSFNSRYLGWFKKHPIYTVLILIFGLPMLIGMISAIFGR